MLVFEETLKLMGGAPDVFNAEASRRAIGRGERIGRLGTEVLEPLTRCLEAWSRGEAAPEDTARLQGAASGLCLGLLRETAGRHLDLPPLGPAREAQLSVQRAAEAYGRLTAVTAEFVSDFSEPFIQSLNRMPAALEDRERPIVSADDLYQTLRDLLDTQYQSYLASPKGVRQVADLVDCYLDFKKCLDEALAPLLRFCGLPTREDMDEVYARLHRLKRAQRERDARLERQAAAIEDLKEEIRSLKADVGAARKPVALRKAAPSVKQAHPKGRKKLTGLADKG